MTEPSASPPPQAEPRWLRGRVLGWAYEADAWLKSRLGRPYTAILGAGLSLGIVATIKSLAAAIQTGRDPLALVATVVFEAALLINQLAQFHEYRQQTRARRRERAEARRRRKG